MTTQTFANPSFGSVALRTFATVPAAIVSAIAESLSALNPRLAREELMRMAQSRAHSDPQLAARLRKAATANWYGEA